MSNSGKVKPVSRGRRRKRDYRVKFDGEIRSATGVWTEEQCRAFLENFNRFLEEQGAVYKEKYWAILVTPNKAMIH